MRYKPHTPHRQAGGSIWTRYPFNVSPSFLMLFVCMCKASKLYVRDRHDTVLITKLFSRIMDKAWLLSRFNCPKIFKSSGQETLICTANFVFNNPSQSDKKNQFSQECCCCWWPTIIDNATTTQSPKSRMDRNMWVLSVGVKSNPVIVLWVHSFSPPGTRCGGRERVSSEHCVDIWGQQFMVVNEDRDRQRGRDMPWSLTPQLQLSVIAPGHN